MWFLSKQGDRKRREKGAMRFLRKGLPARRAERSVAKQQNQHSSAGIFFLWILLAGTFVYIAFFSVFFLIGEPRIMGMSEISEKTLRDFVENQVTGKYAGIVPKRGFFAVRPQTIAERLRMEYPLLASVSVTRVFPDSLRVEVTERQKILLWCSDDRCLLIDEAGVAHDGSRALSPENMPYALLITDTSGKPTAPGETVLDPEYGAFAVRMSGLFPERLGIAIEPRYTTASRFADELRVRTEEGWEAYFGTDIPIESSLRTLKLLFEKELPQGRRATLAYIDLRTENRAYYAFREGENMENPSDTVPPVPTEEKKMEAEPKKKK
ncbi:MAG: FtsQ-type POTRA domain-containing protein [Patescibacteria group bacterium]